VTPLQQFMGRWKGGCGSSICETATKVVFGRGDIPCDILLIGEAPGISEDIIGQAFVGPAGSLLDYILDRALGKPWPYRVAMTNVVCCIPRGEDGEKWQEPPDEAIEQCSERLKEFVALTRPRLIVRVGKIATDWLTPGYRYSITFEGGIPMVDVQHPAFILRQNIAQRGLLVQRAIVTIQNAAEQHLKGKS
jgi:uracil-DNA glycosylase family 4